MVDVVVTDGFTGNVALKLMEGTASQVVERDPRGDPLEPGLVGRRPADPRAHGGSCASRSTRTRTGGAILLGVRRPVVIAHGSSSAEGIANALRLAQRAVDEGMIEKTASALESAGVLRSAPTASFAQADD